ncbi:MAG TPA: acyl-CoA dehydrogenase family protein [Streptosporangiaceae bacterium]|nr:acyl-CoA dehydrogenase family protein [Streptosporangiaceae bacterium]
MTSPAGDVRAEVAAWLAAAWDPDLSLREWRERLADSGWGAPGWPREWCGRGLPPAAAAVVAQELARAGAPGAPEGSGMSLAGPTILAHGSDELKRRFIRPTVTGEIGWCQLFSEPGAGSDLAGLTTTARRADGGGWVVSGQKVWSTSAHHADAGLLLARTDWDVPRHRGISYFILPMRQPGVEVRPLRQMNGYASFNEVFLDEAVVPPPNVIGEVGGGWAVALTTLAHERRLAPPAARAGPGPRPGPGRARREAAAETERVMAPYRWYPQRAGRPDLVIERAVAAGRHTDPLVRQEIVRLITLAWSARWTAQRAAAARAAGRPPGPEGSLAKLAGSNIARAAARAHALIAGPASMLAGADDPAGGMLSEILLSVPAVSIAGGTDQVQRTIVAERILGLPRETSADRDVPFGKVRRSG